MLKDRVHISSLGQHLGRKVTIAGWVDVIRRLKFVQFVMVRDDSGTLQLTNEIADSTEITEAINNLTEGSVIVASGTIVENPKVKIGGMELVIETLEVVSLAESPLPVNQNSNSDTRLDWRFLDLRKPENLLIFKIQTAAEKAMREFWNSEGFIEMHSPKLMGSPSESGAELFRVDYFERDAYLAQSPQFYKQMAMAAGFNKVFEIGPVFRANPSFTSRHDTEFISVDVEMSWVDSHEDVMHMEERWLHFVLSKVKEDFGEQITATFGVEIVVPTLPFPRVTMAEAYEILESVGYKVTRAEKGDLDPEGERTLAKYIFDKYGHEFVFVTDYPATVRAFYHMRSDQNPNLTKSFDLIWKGLEVTTGAQREHRYELLLKQAEEKGVPAESIQYYLNFFRFGIPPHGGYGFGLTRMLMIMLGMKNVREVTYLYRGVNRLTP